MRQRPLGRSGLLVSRMALGTMTWGGQTDSADALAQLRTFLDAGGTLIDTADVYGDGEAETILGALLASDVPRDDLIIATKAGLCPGMQRRIDTSRGHVLRRLDASLRRLGTDHVDLWLAHGFDEHTPLDETLSALDTAVASGRVRYLGVSNFSGAQTARAATWQLAWPGRTPLVAAQLEYSLLQRGIEREAVPACQDSGLGVLAWSPLGRGVLTGKYRHGQPADSRAATGQFERFVNPYLGSSCAGIVEAVLTAADGLAVSPVEVALAWIRDRPGVVAPIIGARTVGQLVAALAAEETTLPAEIARALADVSTLPLGYPERAN